MLSLIHAISLSKKTIKIKIRTIAFKNLIPDLFMQYINIKCFLSMFNKFIWQNAKKAKMHNKTDFFRQI